MKPTWVWLSSSVVALVIALGAGCGSSSSGGASAGRAGESGAQAMNGGASSVGGGTAGASSGAGGTAGNASGGTGLVLGDSKTEVCIAYVVAECQRNEECSGYPPGDCLRASFSCPDAVFSPDSTRTVESLKACVAAFATFPCDKFNAGQLPDCATPGKRALGQACDFSTQCATLECNFTTRSGCGTCAKFGAPGDDCSTAATICPPGTACVSNQCAASPAAGSIRGEGQDCSMPGTSCGPNLYCSAATGLCAFSPTLGMSCAASHACQGSYCSKANQTCTAYPALNQACGVDDATGFASSCASGLVCSTMMQATGMCVPAPGGGQPCYGGYACDQSSVCDGGQQPAQCVALLALGATCVSGSDCQSNLYCQCADGTSTCTSKACSTVHLAGESCGAPNVVCHPGFTCTNGKCEPRDSQGLLMCNP